MVAKTRNRLNKINLMCLSKLTLSKIVRWNPWDESWELNILVQTGIKKLPDSGINSCQLCVFYKERTNLYEPLKNAFLLKQTFSLLITLTLSWWRSLSYRNQSIDLSHEVLLIYKIWKLVHVWTLMKDSILNGAFIWNPVNIVSHMKTKNLNITDSQWTMTFG